MTSNYGQKLWEMDRQHHLHPWTHWDSFKKDGALVLDRGNGSYLYDCDNKKYFDAVGGLWCTNIGLGREEMAEAIADQVRKMAYASAFTDITNGPAAELATKVAQLAPGSLNHVMFTTGGSTAIDSAFRLIQYYQNCRGKHQKKQIISRVASYHGSTYAAMSIAGKKADRVPEFDYIQGLIHHISAPNYYRAEPGLSEADFLAQLVKELEDKILEVGPDNVAAFFAEPVMGAGGVIVPPKGYHKATMEICRRHDVLYVSDEVVTAFGRLGHWFASKDVFDLQPDIITSAKGISSGYLPLGAMIYSDEIHEVISAENPDRVYTSGYTYSAHPVCCAAALKNIEIMEREDILGHVREVGPYFESQLKTLLDLPVVGDVRGTMFMLCVEMVADKETKKLFPDSLNVGKQVANACDDMGLIVRPLVHLNVLSPPLIMTKEEVDFVVSTLRKGIEQVTKGL